jgi:ankyrin repeat protein
MLRTPLHFAAKRGYTSMVDIILDFGADANAKDLLGKKASLEAEKRNDYDLLKKLKKAEAKGPFFEYDKYDNPSYIKTLLPRDIINEIEGKQPDINFIYNC